MALALLPPDKIEIGLECIEKEMEASLKRRFKPLLDYIKRFWITLITPEKFSVYSMTHRTNNVIESHHRVMSSELIGKREVHVYVGESRRVSILFTKDDFFHDDY